MGKIKYLTTCSQLPASAPIGHPHLVDIDSVDWPNQSPQTGFGIADMVVTVLFDHNPKTLKRFLDLSHDFKYYPRDKKPASSDFCITRKGNTVKCGYVIKTATCPAQFYDSIHVYRMEDGPTGKWTPVSCQHHPNRAKTTEEKVLAQGAFSARAFVSFRAWEEFEGIELVVEDSADL